MWLYTQKNTLLYPLIVICLCMDVCVCKQNPSEQGAMAWNWREPTGRVSPWCSPPPTPYFPPCHLFLLAEERRWGGRQGGAQSNVSGEMNRAAVPSVSRKLGSGRSHGTLSWDEQREKAAVQCFSLTSSPIHLCFFYPLCVIFSEAVINFCYALFCWVCL